MNFMKKASFVLLICVCCFGCTQTNNKQSESQITDTTITDSIHVNKEPAVQADSSFDTTTQVKFDVQTLLDYFEKTELPLTIIQETSFTTRLPYEMTLKYFFKGNAKAMEYEKIVINMEDQTEMGRYTRHIEIIPCYYYIFNERIFVIYEFLGEDETKIRIGLLDDKGIEASHLEILYSNYEEAVTTINKISKIYGDVLYIFEYNMMEEGNPATNTRINIKSYTVNYDNNKFVLSSDETIYSPIEFYLFDKYKEEPDSIKSQDPFYKY